MWNLQCCSVIPDVIVVCWFRCGIYNAVLLYLTSLLFIGLGVGFTTLFIGLQRVQLYLTSLLFVGLGVGFTMLFIGLQCYPVIPDVIVAVVCNTDSSNTTDNYDLRYIWSYSDIAAVVDIAIATMLTLIMIMSILLLTGVRLSDQHILRSSTS